MPARDEDDAEGAAAPRDRDMLEAREVGPTVNDYELAVTRCKRLEAILETRLGASGKGLHEKVTSVEGHLPAPLIKRLRYIATVRNKIVHDEQCDRLDDKSGYRQACDLAERELRALLGPAGRIPRALIYAAVAILLILIAAALFVA